MRPPTDCLSPIGEAAIMAGLKKEIAADFYTAVTREPEVYRGNPFQIEVGMAYAKPDPTQEIGAEEPVRVMRFANRVPLLYQAGACAVTRGGHRRELEDLRPGPAEGRACRWARWSILVHMASVWVPFTSESKEAIAHYPEIIKEMTFALQECGRQLSVYLSRRRREAEAAAQAQLHRDVHPAPRAGAEGDPRPGRPAGKNRSSTSWSKMLEKTHLDV